MNEKQEKEIEDIFNRGKEIGLDSTSNIGEWIEFTLKDRNKEENIFYQLLKRTGILKSKEEIDKIKKEEELFEYLCKNKIIVDSIKELGKKEQQQKVERFKKKVIFEVADVRLRERIQKLYEEIFGEDGNVL